MLTLMDQAALAANIAETSRSIGMFYELAPGPDDGRFGSSDGAYFWHQEWEFVASPILASKLPGYDRHDRVCISAEDWQVPLAYMSDLCERLMQADEPAMLHVAGSELPLGLLRCIETNFPMKRNELVNDLRALETWCSLALRRWRSITVKGL